MDTMQFQNIARDELEGILKWDPDVTSKQKAIIRHYSPKQLHNTGDHPELSIKKL